MTCNGNAVNSDSGSNCIARLWRHRDFTGDNPRSPGSAFRIGVNQVDVDHIVRAATYFLTHKRRGSPIPAIALDALSDDLEWRTALARMLFGVTRRSNDGPRSIGDRR